MNQAGDAAEQIVRMSLNGVEVAAKITGTGAKHLVVMIAALLKDQRKTKGKIRLTNMLRSEKPLKVFSVKDEDLKTFCKEAKKYGVLYCVLKDRDANDGLTDIMVRAEDAPKINRIFERFSLTTMDVGEIKSSIDRQNTKTQEATTPQQLRDEEVKAFVEQLMTKEPMETRVGPTTAPTARGSLSGPDSKVTPEDERSLRPSVREDLKKIKNAMEAEQKNPKGKPPRVTEHKQHTPNRKKTKTHKER